MKKEIIKMLALLFLGVGALSGCAIDNGRYHKRHNYNRHHNRDHNNDHNGYHNNDNNYGHNNGYYGN